MCTALSNTDGVENDYSTFQERKFFNRWIMKKKVSGKNPNAVALAKRNKSQSKAGKERAKSLSGAKRSAIARKAGKAGGRGR